ncbi:hypothetical protein, partial [Acidithiobacillus sp.]|uniref:hypothetical protein n=1 Tax=Acidithiobacillus sp. TaxID=1872118 RepID=UPI003569BA4E
FSGCVFLPKDRGITPSFRPQIARDKAPNLLRDVTTAEDNARLLIATGALDSCDAVPRYRWLFLTKAADAFALLLQKNGAVGGRLGGFFKNQGVIHAQSGGVNATLQVYKDGRLVYENTSNTHLKQGDCTTADAAVRIYYQHFSFQEELYVAILHAGPHPDRDITCLCDL